MQLTKRKLKDSLIWPWQKNLHDHKVEVEKREEVDDNIEGLDQRYLQGVHTDGCRKANEDRKL